MTSLSRREKAALLAILSLLTAVILSVHQNRSGVIFNHGTRLFRCKECGELRRERSTILAGTTLLYSSRPVFATISDILAPKEGDPCQHHGELPVESRLVEVTVESFPFRNVKVTKYGDVAGLADNAAFQHALVTLSRTNLTEARLFWRFLCTLDYRSSNSLARLYPALTETSVTEVVTFIKSVSRESGQLDP